MIYTIGLDGLNNFDELYCKIKENNIEYLIDVRLKTVCEWNPDFDGEALGLCLSLKKLCYVSYNHIGIPEGIRQYNNWQDIKKIYQTILLQNKKLLKILSQFAEVMNICLLCAEKNVNECHRLWIAEWMAKENKELKVVHL